jgi:hypothetical protein
LWAKCLLEDLGAIIADIYRGNSKITWG